MTPMPRYEVVVEVAGADGRVWRELDWRHKHGRGGKGVRRMPTFTFLHMPRLDWQTWFLSCSARKALWGPGPSGSPAWPVVILQRTFVD